MARDRNRYRQMERHMTCALLLDLILFIFFLISAGNGIIWLKVILAVICIALSGAYLAFLYISQELLRPRSLWMTAASVAILLCTVFALVLNYPSPNPLSEISSTF